MVAVDVGELEMKSDINIIIGFLWLIRMEIEV